MKLLRKIIDLLLILINSYEKDYKENFQIIPKGLSSKAKTKVIQ
jgi:hypothetical protein